MRKLIALMLVAGAAAAWAGDVAHFVNLGFSEDDRYFLFGQYGVEEKTLYPYAELSLVDVAANRFVPGGVRKATYKIAAEPGANGEGALYDLVRENADLIKRYGIDAVRTGRVLYVLVTSERDTQEELDFRDFQTGTRYRMRLVQSLYGEGRRVESSYYIELVVTPASGASKSYRMGLPGYRRPGVRSYRVSQVILAPRGSALVAVIERMERDSSGANLRYMVETVRLR